MGRNHPGTLKGAEDFMCSRVRNAGSPSGIPPGQVDPLAEEHERSEEPHVAPAGEHLVERTLLWQLRFHPRGSEDLSGGPLYLFLTQVCAEGAVLISPPVHEPVSTADHRHPSRLVGIGTVEDPSSSEGLVGIHSSWS